MKPFRYLCLQAGVLVVCAGPAHAVLVDGVLDPVYGAPLATQTTQTSFGDWPASPDFYGELDGAFGYVASDTLHLFVSGNVSRFRSEPLVLPNQLQLYLDTQSGGQNPMSSANPSVGGYVNLQGIAGLGFDPEFAPDYWLAGSCDQFARFYAFYAELPAGGGGAGYFLGSSTVGGPGALSGGTSNPHGILAAVDLSNTAGVPAGCDAGSGAGVGTGAEWAIPLAALGNPTGPIRVCALLARASGPGASLVSNQLLGPVPPGTCSLGPADTVDLASVPGTQYFVIDRASPTIRSSWGRIKTLFR